MEHISRFERLDESVAHRLFLPDLPKSFWPATRGESRFHTLQRRFGAQNMRLSTLSGLVGGQTRYLSYCYAGPTPKPVALSSFSGLN